MPSIKKGVGNRIVHVTFEVDTKTGWNNLESLRSQAKKFGVELDSLSKKAEKSGKSFISLGRILEVALGVNLSRLTRKIAALPATLLDAAAKSEVYRKELEILTGSTKKANAIFDAMADTSLKVYHSFDSIMKSLTPLALIFGHSTDEMKKWNMVALDMAAALKNQGYDAKTISANLVKMITDSPHAAIAFYRAGITSAMGFVKGVKYTLEERTKMIFDYWKNNWAGAAEYMGSTWYGLLQRMKNQWFLVTKSMAEESGLLKFIKDIGEELFNAFEKLRKSGMLPKITQEILTYTLSAIDVLILGSQKLVGFIMDIFTDIESVKAKLKSWHEYFFGFHPVVVNKYSNQTTDQTTPWWGIPGAEKTTPWWGMPGEERTKTRTEIVLERDLKTLSEGISKAKNLILATLDKWRAILDKGLVPEEGREEEKPDPLKRAELKRREADLEKLQLKGGRDAYWKYIEGLLGRNVLGPLESMKLGFTNVTEHFRNEAQRWYEIGKGAAGNLTDTFQNVFFDAMTTKLQSFRDYWCSFWQGMAQIASQHLAQLTYASLFGPPGQSWKYSPASLLNWMGGKIPAKPSAMETFLTMDRGGIATRPSLVAERGRPEAVVPLPNGRSIPVQMSGNQGQNVHVYQIYAMDPASFTDYCSRNRGAIVKVIHEDIRYNRGLSNAIRAAL